MQKGSEIYTHNALKMYAVYYVCKTGPVYVADMPGCFCETMDVRYFMPIGCLSKEKNGRSLFLVRKNNLGSYNSGLFIGKNNSN